MQIVNRDFAIFELWNEKNRLIKIHQFWRIFTKFY